MDGDTWNVFSQTGKVSDYLQYTSQRTDPGRAKEGEGHADDKNQWNYNQTNQMRGLR